MRWILKQTQDHIPGLLKNHNTPIVRSNKKSNFKSNVRLYFNIQSNINTCKKTNKKLLYRLQFLYYNVCDEVQKSFNTYIVIYNCWEVLQIYLCDKSRLNYKTVCLYQDCNTFCITKFRVFVLHILGVWYNVLEPDIGEFYTLTILTYWFYLM